MNTFRLCWSGLVVVLLTAVGCSGPLYLQPPSVTFRPAPHGVQARIAQGQVNFRPRGNMPVIRQRFDGGWFDVSNGIIMPPRGGEEFKLDLNGRTTTAYVIYDGQRKDCYRPDWKFWLENSGDGPGHVAWVVVHYNNWGLPPEQWATPDSLPIPVYNTPLNQ